jgi:hypothetical protein
MSKGWIGVDLDGTLAEYDRWRGVDHIGEPVPLMLDRVKGWVAAGREVRIFTARVGGPPEEALAALPVIRDWLVKHLGRALQVTCTKDYGMVELWDDRAVQVIPNTGRTIADELESERSARAGKGP